MHSHDRNGEVSQQSSVHLAQHLLEMRAFRDILKHSSMYKSHTSPSIVVVERKLYKTSAATLQSTFYLRTLIMREASVVTLKVGIKDSFAYNRTNRVL